jgi:hypothetical protein
MTGLTRLVGGGISEKPQHTDNRNQTQEGRKAQRLRSHIVSMVGSTCSQDASAPREFEAFFL